MAIIVNLFIVFFVISWNHVNFGLLVSVYFNTDVAGGIFVFK